ncbi:MAG: hypothetical protein JOZ29_18500 [Deltaproteobacteria bacterium]|nr:hypothetical protein [Deltaproteobacteria bacterium]
MRTFIPFTSDDEIISIGRGLVARTLPKSSWTHAAHFAAALWLLARHPEIDILRAMPGMIRAYNEATGVANTDTSGYHETITHASTRAARAFLADRARFPLFVTCNELMLSPLGNPEWLLAYWSRPRLFSVEARRTWIEPEIRPFPF